MRRTTLAAGAVAAATLATLAVHGAAEPLPAGRLSLVGGGKTGTGRLANDIGMGYAFGFEAQYAPMGPTQRLGWGLSWSTVWSTFGGGARVSGTLSMVEMDLGLRARVALGAQGNQVLWMGGGGALLRTNDPILDDDRRSHVGPFGAAGIEGRVRLPWLGWRAIWGVSARYGLIADGQGTLGLLLSLGAGS